MLAELAVEHGDGIKVGEKVLCDTFGLTWLEAGFLKALLYYSLCGPEEFPQIGYSPRNYMYVLRKKLGAYNITINTYWRQHYGIPKADKDRIAKLVGLVPEIPTLESNGGGDKRFDEEREFAKHGPIGTQEPE